MGAASRTQGIVWRPDAQLFKKDITHFIVVVLLRMDDLVTQCIPVLVQCSCHGCNLDKIGPRTGNEEEGFGSLGKQHLHIVEWLPLTTYAEALNL